jgi:hypothetical protein
MKTQETKLRILKNDVVYFHLADNFDGNNTVKCFINGFIIRKGKRIYLTDLNITNWKPLQSFNSYADYYSDAKEWINKNTNLQIRYISDYHNIIVSGETVTKKEFKQLIR